MEHFGTDLLASSLNHEQPAPAQTSHPIHVCHLYLYGALWAQSTS